MTATYSPDDPHYFDERDMRVGFERVSALWRGGRHCGVGEEQR